MKIIYKDRDLTVSQTSLLIMAIVNVVTFKKIDKVDNYVKEQRKKMTNEMKNRNDDL